LLAVITFCSLILAATALDQYIFPARGNVPEYYMDQIVLIVVLFMIIGFVRECFRLLARTPIFRDLHPERLRVTIPFVETMVLEEDE